jgi:phosphatidylglycerophosphatase A
VIDEAAGQWLALLLLPVFSWKTASLSFLLFRAFDIWKPCPAAQAERLPGGVGIMADDLVAGLYANLAVQGLCLVPGTLPFLS